MDLLFSDQAQPILVIALLAGLGIGVVVFVLASRRAARAAADPATPRGQAPGNNSALKASTGPAPAPSPRRPLSRDTRQRATNLINDIAQHEKDQQTG